MNSGLMRFSPAQIHQKFWGYSWDIALGLWLFADVNHGGRVAEIAQNFVFSDIVCSAELVARDPQAHTRCALAHVPGGQKLPKCKIRGVGKSAVIHSCPLTLKQLPVVGIS